MDNKKIGKFISLLRKEKNMTQSDLANELFVTDKAVSRWERGIGLPDITILHSLSCILGVSIEELLNGEKNNLSTDNLELIKIRKKNKKLKRIICTLLIIFILIGIFIFIKYKYRFDITVKEDYSLILTSNYKDTCNSQMDLLYEDETKRIYSYCVPKVTIMNNKTKELISFKDLDKNKSDEIFENIFYDKNLFNSVNNSFAFQDENTNILVYNSFDSTGSKIINIYIGSDNLNRRNYFSNYESEFTRTYKVLGKSIIDNTLYLSLSSTKSSITKLEYGVAIIDNDMLNDLDINKYYEFTFKVNNTIYFEDNINSIFSGSEIVSYKEVDSNSEFINDYL